MHRKTAGIEIVSLNRYVYYSRQAKMNNYRTAIYRSSLVLLKNFLLQVFDNSSNVVT